MNKQNAHHVTDVKLFTTKRNTQKNYYVLGKGYDSTRFTFPIKLKQYGN